MPADATITDTTLPVVITIVFFCFFFSTRKHFSFSHLRTISHYESLVIMQDLLSRFDLLFLEYSCELSGPSAVSSIKYEQTIRYQNLYSPPLPENKRLPLAEVYLSTFGEKNLSISKSSKESYAVTVFYFICVRFLVKGIFRISGSSKNRYQITWVCSTWKHEALH